MSDTKRMYHVGTTCTGNARDDMCRRCVHVCVCVVCVCACLCGVGGACVRVSV